MLSFNFIQFKIILILMIFKIYLYIYDFYFSFLDMHFKFYSFSFWCVYFSCLLILNKLYILKMANFCLYYILLFFPFCCIFKCNCFALFLLCWSVIQSCPTLWPRGLQHVRPPCPSPSTRACSNSCPFLLYKNFKV